LNADEIRAQSNLNPLPNGQGKAYIVPLNHAPLEDVLAGKVNRSAKQLRGDDADSTALPEFDSSFLAALIKVATDPLAIKNAVRDGERAEKVRVDESLRDSNEHAAVTDDTGAVDPAAGSGDARGNTGLASGTLTERSDLEAFALRVLGEGYERMVRLEAERAGSAAAKGGKAVGEWMAKFYPKFEETLAEAISTGIAGVFAARGWPEELVAAKAWEIARLHCASSQALLLAATECQPGELRGKISDCVAEWPAVRKDELLKRLAA
jgi:hypothetical protein